MKYYIKIAPQNPLFFRKGNRFTKGKDTWAESYLLPNPSTIWGALFAKLMADNTELSKKVKNENLTNDKLAEILTIEDIMLYDGTSFIVPAPSICLKEKNSFSAEYPKSFINLDEEGVISSNNEIKYIPSHDGDYTESSTSYHTYYENLFESVSKSNLIPSERLLKQYPKIGIKINNNTGISEESMLYNTDVTEFNENYSIVVEVEIHEDYKFKEEKGFLKLGGESNVSKYAMMDSKRYLRIKNVQKFDEGEDNYTDLFAMYFKTSAILQNNELKEVLEKSNFKIICVKFNGSFIVGGYDMKKNCQKDKVKAIGAGSCYIVKYNEKTESKKLKELLNKELNTVKEYQGFGKYEIIGL
ncbi:type III-B CRISPR module-associated Cmr3 family protein [Methanococcus voltae]|uniref:CRISPR-associated protein, Cmr3 n=1 Tax=Methanococcus voltae (strain ATCC BAA-1334 / A3) TaxID=456320 RepID=D7DSV3_METV3|nr:type III-B CRISPR module-associated Cmr3 family protein [Methanococcus voltae]MCS3901813.1 CRISPR-associated protein Cmr3 [Methanococcus voltae]